MLLFASSAANASFTYTAKRKCKLLIQPLSTNTPGYINIAGVSYYVNSGTGAFVTPNAIPIYLAAGQSITISNPAGGAGNLIGCIVSVLEE